MTDVDVIAEMLAHEPVPKDTITILPEYLRRGRDVSVVSTPPLGVNREQVFRELFLSFSCRNGQKRALPSFEPFNAACVLLP